jgi:hypothetical protein
MHWFQFIQLDDGVVIVLRCSMVNSFYGCVLGFQVPLLSLIS